ncbi:MAG: T9SS type A sorting domain-containing protein [Chitinophagaceae bacterium]|nr:T9SS type A sorting domain-containing protein [Chitinophagaceae bacterium]
MFKQVVAAFFCPLLICSLSLKAQTHTPKANVTTCSMSNGYYEYLPEGYWNNPSQKFPMIIFVPGAAECGNGTAADLVRVLMHGPASLINSGTWPGSFTVSGNTYKPIVITPQFTNQPSSSVFNTMLDYMVSHYKVDINRIYISGYSMGGSLCWSYGGSNSTFAGRIAAMVPGAGAYSPNSGMANTMATANLPVLAIHDNPDPSVPTQWSVTWVNYINSAPVPPNPLAKVALIQITGHDLTEGWSLNFNNNNQYNFPGKNVWEWMLHYSRNYNVVPVTLVAFNAHKQNNNAVLNWQTQNEVNINGYEIQRSSNGTSWQTIGFVQSNGNYGQYSFTDASIINGKNFYRIKIIDNSSTQSYSRIQFLDFSKKGYFELTPNLVTGNTLHISTDYQLKNARLTVLNALGQMVAQQNISGTGLIPLTLSPISRGLYFIEVKNKEIDEKRKFLIN